MDTEALRELIPWFLDQKSKSDLFDSVKQLASGNLDYTDYFTSDYDQLPDELSQGDIVTDLPIITLPRPLITNNLGMILSNSCGMSADNDKPLLARIVYAPAISLENLMPLIGSKVDVPIFLTNLKKQQIMNVFYLPIGQYNDKERVVLFDNILSADMIDGTPRDRVKTRLSRKAYYHLLIKLTAYFARTTQELVTERP